MPVIKGTSVKREILLASTASRSRDKLWPLDFYTTSPTTNEPLASLQLLPNHLAKKAIADEMDARRGTAGSR